jgi:hypothetical protein
VHRYFFKNIQAANPTKTSTTTQRDELLISVFLDMHRILSEPFRLCESGNRRVSRSQIGVLPPFGCSQSGSASQIHNQGFVVAGLSGQFVELMLIHGAVWRGIATSSLPAKERNRDTTGRDSDQPSPLHYRARPAAAPEDQAH